MGQWSEREKGDGTSVFGGEIKLLESTFGSRKSAVQFDVTMSKNLLSQTFLSSFNPFACTHSGVVLPHCLCQ